MDQRRLEIGQQVVYHDSRSRPMAALVTAIWGWSSEDDEYDGGEGAKSILVGGKYDTPCVNLVWVSIDRERQDSYGRQIERETSVVHASDQSAHGNYWRFMDEEPNKFIAPVS